MATSTAVQLPCKVQPADEYPSSDGKPMAETEIDWLVKNHLINALRYLFRSQPTVYVTGGIYFYYRQDRPDKRVAPDVMVFKGVDTNTIRRSYKLWEEQVVPSVIIEIISKERQQQDIVAKPALYAQLGVQEFFMFDALGEYIEEQIWGFQTQDGEMVSMKPDCEGDLHSQTLGTIMSKEGPMLRIIDPQTSQFIPIMQDALVGAEKENQRATAAEAEVERLRTLLKQVNIDDQA